MLDLPTPRTLEECTEHARQYADYLLSSPEIKAMAWLRLNIQPDDHPRWFILWIDLQISKIKYRIEILSNWTRASDPEYLAGIVLEMSFNVLHMMRLATDRVRYHPAYCELKSEWLTELTSGWLGEDLPI